MLLDIFILLILLFSAIHGFRRGFVFTLIHTVGWAISLVVAYLLTPAVASFMKESTGFYSWIRGIVQPKFDLSLEAMENALDSIPASVAPSIESSSAHIAQDITDAIVSVMGTVLIFVLLFFLLKIVLWLLLRLLSRDYRNGFANFFDGLLGMIFGLAKGALLVMVLLALLLPVTNMTSTGLTAFLNAQLGSSVFAESLYDGNFLLMLIQNYL